MKYHKTCECCGNKETAYTLGLNTPMTQAFIQFAKIYKEKGAVKKGEIGLRNEQYSNFQNLQHFGIIQQINEQRWILTTKGEDFLKGVQSVTVPAAHMGGETLPENHEAWDTHEKEREQKYIHEILGESIWEYRQREDFVEEKSDRQKLF